MPQNRPLTDNKSHEMDLGLKHQDYLDDDKEKSDDRHAEHQNGQSKKNFKSCFHMFIVN